MNYSFSSSRIEYNLVEYNEIQLQFRVSVFTIVGDEVTEVLGRILHLKAVFHGSENISCWQRVWHRLASNQKSYVLRSCRFDSSPKCISDCMHAFLRHCPRLSSRLDCLSDKEATLFFSTRARDFKI